jgi:site-specific recombinase XerD
MIKEFQNFLEKSNLSKNTVASYVTTVNIFQNRHKTFTHRTLARYKCSLVELYKPATVNLRLHAINRYLGFIKKEKLRQQFVKIQPKQYVENVISNADYLFLKDKLRLTGQTKWYFLIWLLATTGARISELLQIQGEHIRKGYMDVRSKGGKVRRLYIPKKLRNNAIKWLGRQNLNTNYVFKNRQGKPVSARSIAYQLKHFARKYGLDTQTVYPHSFRHLFAKNFLDKCADITLLADLMGHRSVETTRIYLRRTACEQQSFINKIVTW